MWWSESTMKMYECIAFYYAETGCWRENRRYDTNGEFLKWKLKSKRKLQEAIKEAIKDNYGEENDALASQIFSYIKDVEEKGFYTGRFYPIMPDTEFIAHLIPRINKMVRKVYED